MSEDVTDHGAVPDDGSNDTEAFIRAAEAANGGTVTVPEGTFVLDSKRWSGGSLHFGDKSAYQPSGTSVVGAGPEKTTVRMEGGHSKNYQAFVYHESGDHDGAVVRDLTLDGNQWNQGGSGDMPNGFAVQVYGDSQEVQVENCRLVDWSLTGGAYQARDTVIRNCEFIDNGRAVLEVNGYNGHGLNVSNDASSVSDSGLLIEGCLFENNAGNSVDNNGGNFTMRRCFSVGNGKAVKFNDGVRTTVEHCRFRDVRRRGFKTVGTSDHTELTEFYDVELTTAGYEGVATRTSGRIEGDNVLIDTANTDDFHNGEAVRLENKSVDIGVICVTGTPHGSAFDITDSSGTIDELVHGDNADGVGPLDDVSVGTKTAGDTLDIDAPAADEVGVEPTDTTDTTDSSGYEHVLEVRAAEGAELTTYAVTVTGEAVVGEQSNVQESVTETAEGNYKLEGQVADGGTDDFQFDGEILTSDSSIDGGATAYVDGSAVDLSGDTTDDSDADAEFGSYAVPDPGATDWHEPLNDNFDQLRQDVQLLNERLAELEDQLG